MITFECPHCRQRLITPVEYAGQEGNCPRCAQPVRVPEGAALSPPPEPRGTPEAAEPVSYPFNDADPVLVPPDVPAAAAEPPPTPPTQQPETVVPATVGPRPAVPPHTVQAPGYQLLEEIGRGGMGVVFRANQLRLNRVVALKMILGGSLAGPEELGRFHAEATAAAALQHPNIVQIYEVGEQDGLPYFSMEYLPGASLAQELHGTPRPARAAAELVATLAHAIHYAHQHGIVHRDLKPANVLLAEDGTPKITDFGLAKRLDRSDGQTQSGVILGTPSYMSPEQAAGKTHRVGPASDVYALGAFLYELFTGRPPFKSATPVETIFHVIHDEPVSPGQLQPRLPHDLETICLKCLEKEPRARYPSARALEEDLRRFLNNEPIQAQPTRSWERGLKWARRRPAVAALLVVSGVAVLALVVATMAFAYNSRLQAALRATEVARADAEAAQRQEEVQRRLTVATLRNSLYLNRIALARREWLSDRVGRADQLLDECPVDARRWEWFYLKRLCHAELRTLPAHREGVADVAYSRDGRLLASAGYDNLIRIWESATGRGLAVLRGHTSWVRGVCFSPDGQRLASAADDETVRVWDVAVGHQLARLTGHRGHVTAVAFRPVGAGLASAGADGAVRFWDLEGRRELFHLQGHSTGLTSLAWSADGRGLAAAGAEGTVQVWDVTTRAPRFTIRGHTKEVTRVAFSPDGQRLATASHDRTVRVWSAADGRELFTLSGHPAPVHGLAFSPDGRRLASAGLVVRLWDTGTGDERVVLRGHTRPILSVAFSPDGGRLASAGEDGTVRIWDARAHPEHRTLAVYPRGVTAIAFSSDSRRLASAGEDGTVQVWEAATGQRLCALPRQDKPVAHVTFSPDGRRLATACGWTVKFWDAATGQELRTFDDKSAFPVFSPDGGRLATVGWETTEAERYLPTVRVWDAETGQEMHTLRGQRERLHCLAFSPDGQTLAAAGDDRVIKLWDVATGREGPSIAVEAQDIFTLSFSPDGRRIAAVSGGFGLGASVVKLWEVTTGQEVLSLNSHADEGEFLGAAFAPDAERLASVGVDGVVKIWDTTAGAEILTLTGHTSWVTHAVFSPDGQRLATAGRDGQVILWDATPLAK